jgi:hypothetical protein
MHGLVRQGICSLLLTRNDPEKRQANRWKGLLAEKPRTASVSEIDTAANPLETDQEMLASRFD